MKPYKPMKIKCGYCAKKACIKLEWAIEDHWGDKIYVCARCFTELQKSIKINVDHYNL
jgi:DNA-directed RNA polymerase subunit RPC12/RpoP